MTDGPGREPEQAGEGVEPPLAAISPDLVSLADYERRASAHIPAASWRHIQSGAGAERSLADNRSQFDAYRLVPRRLVPMQGATTEIELFGLRHAAPLLLAPVAYHRLAHPQGEMAAMGAATALDTTMVVSTLSSQPLEQIADSARQAARDLGRALPPLWFQLYLQPDPAHNEQLVRRAEAAGYQLIVLTVDAAVKLTTFPLPPGVEAANLRDMPSPVQRAEAQAGRILFGTPFADAVPDWESLAWLRRTTRLPIVVKGLLSPDDCRKAVELGADGIIVSNHGGRVLDGLATPMDMLPSIVEAVGGRVPLLLDGGVRTGTDALKALALGASAVLVGRPQLHALAVAGVAGVAHMLHMLRAELELAMLQTGCRTVEDIGPRLLLRV